MIIEILIPMFWMIIGYGINEGLDKIRKKNKKVICKFCNNPIDYNLYEEHVRGCLNKNMPQKCEFCSETFIGRDKLSLHMADEHPRMDKYTFDKSDFIYQGSCTKESLYCTICEKIIKVGDKIVMFSAMSHLDCYAKKFNAYKSLISPAQLYRPNREMLDGIKSTKSKYTLYKVVFDMWADIVNITGRAPFRWPLDKDGNSDINFD